MKRFGLIFFLLIALMGGAYLCVSHWGDWFTNSAEPVYTAEQTPHRVVMTFGETPSHRVFSWRSALADSSAYVVLDGDTLPAWFSTVASRSGEAVYYRAYSPSLAEGQHTYFIASGQQTSEFFTFTQQPDSCVRFCLFGDLDKQDSLIDLSPYHFVAYTGSLLEYPTDDAWQNWFTLLDGQQAVIPQMAVPGLNEYLKGLNHQLDPRWLPTFGNPENGPVRFRGTSYYVDYPSFRLVMLNTAAFTHFSDFTISQTWLKRALQEADDKWKIVVMHHPIYAAAVNSENMVLHAVLRHTLEDADIVFAGHDLNYARRGNNPLYVVTSSSAEGFPPKCSFMDERIGSNRAFYEDVQVTADSLMLTTYLLKTGEVYDRVKIAREDRVVKADTCLMPEILEMPEAYSTQHYLSVKRSYNRMRSRQKE